MFYDINVSLLGIDQRQDLKLIYIFEIRAQGIVYSIQIRIQDILKIENLVEITFPTLQLPIVSKFNSKDLIVIQFQGLEI